MSSYLISVLFVTIITIPIWIRWIGQQHWRQSTKEILIIIQVLISTGFTIALLLKPGVNSTTFSIIVTDISIGLYYIVVLISAMAAWPRQEDKLRYGLNSAHASKFGHSKANHFKKIGMKENKAYVSIPVMSGKDGEAAVVLLNTTVQINPDGTKRYPHPEFGTWLIDELYTVKKVIGVQPGLFNKHAFCPNCNTVLNPTSRTPKQLEYELQFGSFPPLKIQITMPCVECPKCQKICGVNVKGTLSNHLNEAIIHAFKSQEIEP
jgi:hypothetical protein